LRSDRLSSGGFLFADWLAADRFCSRNLLGRESLAKEEYPSVSSGSYWRSGEKRLFRLPGTDLSAFSSVGAALHVCSDSFFPGAEFRSEFVRGERVLHRFQTFGGPDEASLVDNRG